MEQINTTSACYKLSVTFQQLKSTQNAEHQIRKKT